MEINVAELKSIVGEAKKFPVCAHLSGGELFGNGVEFTKPVTGTVTATNTGQGISVKGKIATELTVKCSRCLKPFILPLVAEVEGAYREMSGELMQAEQDTIDTDSQNDAEVNYFRGDVIDLTGLLEEGLLLAFPLKPVCRVDCRGICPICGQDLNLKVCNCKEEQSDPRLAVLKQFFKEQKGV